jgi:hypothetical protein
MTRETGEIAVAVKLSRLQHQTMVAVRMMSRLRSPDVVQTSQNFAAKV